MGPSCGTFETDATNIDETQASIGQIHNGGHVWLQIKVKMQLPVSSRPVTGSEEDQRESNTK